MALRMQRRCAQQLFLSFVRSTWVLSAVLASLLTSRAAAQNGHEVSLARALFEEGVALGDRGEWSAAADRFERAYALKPTPGIAFNWASALSAIGKLTEASELLESVSRDAKAAPELKSESERKLLELAPRRPKLKLRVDESIKPSSDVSVDGKPWPRAVWDVAVPVNPGEHVAIAKDGQVELARAEISLSEGQSAELALRVVAPEPSAREVVASEDIGHEPKPARDKPPLYKNWILWTCVGAVVVGGTVAAVVLSTRGGTRTEAPTAGNAGVIRW